MESTQTQLEQPSPPPGSAGHGTGVATLSANAQVASAPRPTLAERLRSTPPSWIWGTLLGLGGYIAIMHFTLGNRWEQFGAAAIFLSVVVWSDRTRRFAMGMLPMLAQGVIYDLTHLTQPLVKYLHVHIEEPYWFDKTFFGIPTALGRVTPNEFFATRFWAPVDFVTGSAYILFLYWSLLFCGYLSATASNDERYRRALRYGWAFFVMNVVGYATYYIYPAAPPWYVTEHGFGPPDFTVMSSAAAAVRWDAMTGLGYFKAFYGRSADVFGAIPSLHVAHPLLIAVYALEFKSRALKVGSFLFYALMCFSAVYLQHHYVLDVLIGSAFALGAYWLVERLFAAQAERVPVRAEPSPGIA